MPDPAPRRRWRRPALIALAVLVLLPATAILALLLAFDPNSQKPRIQAAVQAATGRQLELGPIGLKLALAPTLTLQDVSLANAPGGSRPQMASIRRVEVELALLPLLSRRVEVRRLVLVGPDILLETDAEGRPNWAFTPAARPAEPATAPEGPATAPATEAPATAAQEAGRRLGIAIDRVDLTEGRLAWRDGRTGATRSLDIARIETRADPASGALRLTGGVALNGVPIALTGETGPLDRLLDPATTTPWPVRLGLEAAGARLAASGGIAQPRQFRGVQLAVEAQVPELQKLAPLLPDAPLPPLRDLALTANLTEATVSDLRLSLGAAVLDAVLPGLHLASLTATLPRQDAPLALAAEARLNDLPLRLAGTLGSPALLMPGAAPQPWPLDLTVNLAGATGTARGSIADPRRLAGVDLALGLRAPDLAALAPLAGAPLPPVRDLAIDTHLAERTPGFAGGAILRGVRIASSAGDAAGDLVYVIGQRQGFTGSLASNRLDLDALRPPAAPPAAAAAPAAPPPAPDRRVIPNLPLPLEALRIIDTDLRWQVASLVAHGLTLQGMQLHLVMQDGRARLDPLSATLPGGPVALRAAADLTTTPPTVQVAAQSPGLDLAPLLTAFGQNPPQVTGHLDLDADLRGQGSDLRAVAGSAHGHLGLALVRGSLAGSVVERLPAELRRLLPAGASGREIPLRCAALRFQVEDGMAQSRALLLDTALGRMGGEGGLNLKTEALAFRLMPDLRLAGIELRAPVNVAGTLHAPRIGVSPEAAIAGGLGAFLSLQNSPDRSLQALAGAFGGGGGELPDCESQLAIARGGRPGPAPAAAQAASPPPAPTRAPAPALPGAAQELLRGLFGR
ncbi:AsmA family protein [Belnapia rosea]|uniref:AsmA family protein n=1 Tax=Belnapia rosea TaxID=938405 RepID=UPI0008915C46|nr:AsmA family protein [Belnapia rosea]SDB55934.1 AsmA protein [Belnapia rosea]